MNKVHLMGYEKMICSFINFLSFHLHEFLQSEIKQKLSSVQKITSTLLQLLIRKLSVFYVSGVLCFSLALFFSGIHNE